MDIELNDILSSYATKTQDNLHNYSTFYDPQAKWLVKPENYQNFLVNYCTLIDKKLDQGDLTANICLAEKPKEISPIIINLTLKFPVDNDTNWELCNDIFLKHLCSIYQDIIYDHYKTLNENEVEFLAIVLESGKYFYDEKKEHIFTEIRLQFPYSCVDCSSQNAIIRSKAIRTLRNKNILSKLDRQPIGDWDQIISKCQINESMLMYGSSDVKDKPKQILKYIWPYITEEILNDDESIPANEVFENIFFPEIHPYVKQGIIPRDIFQGQGINFCLPIFLSLNYWQEVLLQKEDNEIEEQQKEEIFGSDKNVSDDMTEIELLERLLLMLKHERFFREVSWLDIGRAFYYIDTGCEKSLALWVKHTKRVVGESKPADFMLKFGSIDNTCRNYYNKFYEGNITIKTIAWYAREDNAQKYANWHRSWCLSSMEKALSLLHTDVANAFYRNYWLDFVYYPFGNGGRWYYFKNHRWNESGHGLNISEKISNNFVERFELARISLLKQAHNSGDETVKNNTEITVKKITSLICKLKTVQFKGSIFKELKEKFNNEKFVSLLDSNLDLTGVVNGVIEASSSTIYFRSGKPEDYIFKCTGIPFPENYNWADPLVKEMMEWVSKVFVDKTLLHYFLKFSASCLKSGNNDKIFPIWSGEGGNSKSMCVKLFESVFGDYCIKFQASVLTGKTDNASGATPQMARSKAVKVGFIDETEDDVPLRKDIIKRMTGGDSFFARLLHENGSDIKLSFKMILQCNKIPATSSVDKAIMNRLKVFPFMSEWTDNAPESKEEQYKQRKFKCDSNFGNRIPELAPAFLWICTQYYKYYCDEGLKVPEIVDRTTENYWKENDIYAQFISECIKEAIDINGKTDLAVKITLSEIYSEFKIWHKEAYPSSKIPERSIVRTELSRRWGKMQGNSWHGIRISLEGDSNDLTSSLGGRSNQVNLINESIKPALSPNINVSTLQHPNNSIPIGAVLI